MISADTQAPPSPNAMNGVGVGNEPHITTAKDGLEVLCGPLLNYKGLTTPSTGSPTWYGSVLLVTKPGHNPPVLQLKCIGTGGPEVQRSNAIQGASADHVRIFDGVKLYEDPIKAFWRLSIDLPLQDFEACWEYSIANMHFLTDIDAQTPSRKFVVPSSSQSMRIMFHSCNGFSVGTDEADWCGPVLWKDVIRVHDSKPFHVMIGGGDQIYNDGVRVGGPLKQWTSIGNPHKRREYPFGETLRSDCDKYYFDNYARWYSSEPFATANAQIPQINIWDDHDIIDGFGSYTDHFMKCAVFRGIGGVSLKYYCLFQHHIPPPKSTFTTDSKQTTHPHAAGSTGADPAQLKDTFVLQETKAESSFILGKRPGPYVEECSRSLYFRLGARIAFLGIDARTERTRHQVNYPDTYETIFKRVRSELDSSSGIKHMIVLLGVPIAYPRLAWLENVLRSPIIAPVRLLNKRFGLAGGLFNSFDGSVDLLDDLDDHYTARQHKKERKDLIHRLQTVAKDHDIRVTILGGDVHLAALGRFYSKPKLNIPADHDHRYMANIVSSAITNKPPPVAVANLLARRNKIHHLDHQTDETLMNMFDKNPGSSQKTANFNKCTMPSRNYAIITEAPEGGHIVNGTTDGSAVNQAASTETGTTSRKDGHSFLHAGEDGAGTKHVAASGVSVGTIPGGLDVSIRVEVDQHDPEGKTEGYGFSIPQLKTQKSPAQA